MKPGLLMDTIFDFIIFNVNKLNKEINLDKNNCMTELISVH